MSNTNNNTRNSSIPPQSSHARFRKAPAGGWYLTGMGKPPRPGSWVIAETKAGELWRVKVSKVFWCGDGVTGSNGNVVQLPYQWEATIKPGTRMVRIGSASDVDPGSQR